MAPRVEVFVQVIVNELVEEGLVPPEYREEAVQALSREMRRQVRNYASNLLRGWPQPIPGLERVS